MASCTVCASSLRALIDSDLIVGKTPTQIVRGLHGVGGPDGVAPLTVASVQRHKTNHLRHGGISSEQVTQLSAEEIQIRLTQLAANAQKVHQDAMKSGNGVLAIRAAAQAQSALVELNRSKDLAAESAESADYRHRLVRAIQRAARNRPQHARETASAARELGDEEVAADAEELAAKAESYRVTYTTRSTTITKEN